MEPPALAAGPVAPVRAAPGASADLVLPPPRGTQPFTYHWSRAGASLDERFTTSEDAGGVRLTVSAAQTGDSGVYTLQASNAAGSDSSKICLEVAAEEAPTGDDPPTFLRRLQDLTVKVGSRTRFLVEIISSTECKVTWYRNERRLLEAERVALARDGNFWCADVAAVSVDDAGRWTCTAENAGGRASCSAHLNVLVPKAYKRPEFVEELRALLTEQGTVSLECKVVGVPTPVLRWFKDSREIKAGDVFALTANAEDPTSLGTYTCEAVNCMGRAYSSSKVHVVGRASREGSARPSSSSMTPEPPPIFTKELEDTHVKICDQLTLGCHIVVPPWPRSVVWYNKDGKVEPGERYHALEDGVGGYLLEIPSAEWADEGEWKCVATSAGGRVGITTCYVAMDVPKNYRKPRFMENLQAVLTEEGLVSFECKVVGFPTPVLSWFKDGQELKPGDVYQLTGTNSLGSYCCIARNCMGQASSSAELTVEDIQNQLNEEEKLQLFSKNQAPKFMQGLKSVEAKIDEPFRFTVKVAIPPEPSVLWYRDDQPVDESTRCHLDKEDKGLFNLDIQNLEFLDQAEWKCVAINDFGHSVTSCFLKLVIPRHYKKPRFLENLQAILSDEGAVNLECKVIGVPQPVLKWYKDGEELKPGDIHRIISGQDGTCCLGTYTCEAQNCMGIAASSASLLGFDDSMKIKAKKAEEQALQRNLSLSTIHEERTSQMYDTPVGDITLDDKGEISFSFDGKEVSVSLYETPDLTEEEALQIVEMYADQLSENVTEHNVVELPPLRFVKETSTSGNLLMEAIIIDVSPEYFAVPDEDLRTEADVEDLSIAEENGAPQLSLDQDIEIGGEDYLEKTMALLTDERSDFAAKSSRKKSDSQRSADDFFSLSRDQSLSEGKRDDDTHVSESDLQSFASARSSAKVKSKSSKPSGEDGQESSEPTKTILFKEEIASKSSKIDPTKQSDQDLEVPVIKPKRERRTSRGSRRSSTSSEKSISKSREEFLRPKKDVEHLPKKPPMNDEEFKNTMSNISTSLTKVINDVQLIERDIILKSELMSSAATASRSLEIISSLITPLSEINSIADAANESISESREVISSIFNGIPQPLKALHQSLTIIEKCISMESDNRTLVKKTCVAFIETCGTEVQRVISDIISLTAKEYILIEDKIVDEIDSVAREITTVIKFSAETVKARNILTKASEIKSDESTLESKHLRDTQKAIFELKSPLNSLLRIVECAEGAKLTDLAKIKNSEVIMNDMSASIQDLQTALEQIESLSVKESSSSLQKYNTEIIETVMESVLKLRGSFELLSTEPNVEEDKTVLIQVLSSLKENLTEISHHIEAVDKNVGQFDVLQSENKLDVLQKMAQNLIALENNLPRLEALPEVKSHMDTFHKNLTKVLEKVIESNDAKKYLTMMEICDTVKIINSSIKNLDSENVLPLASLSNTLKIIETHFINNIFESELNCSLMNNISDVLVGIQEAINKAEETSLQIDSEYIQDFSTQVINEAKVNIILEHIDQTIAAVNTIKTIESTQELKLVLKPALENVCPILEELKRSVASVRLSQVENNEHVSEISETSFALTLATPLCELNQNIIVLNQLIVENIDSIKENTEIVTAIAEPLHELFTTLEILQQDVISQYGDDLTPYEVSVNMASVVQNLQSCIVLIHEQAGIEGADEMSTLEDISGIKTSADTLPSDRLVLPTAEETAIEQSLPPFTQEVATTATAHTLQSLNEHIMVLQTPEVIEALDSLSEVNDYSSLKSVAVNLGDLHNSLEGILHPVPIEGSIDLDDLINISKLAAIAEPMQEIQQSLSVLDTSNIPIYENIIDMPTEKIHSVFQSITEFKNSLEQCMCALLPAMEIANNTIEISNKVSSLREVCEQLKEIFETSEDPSCDIVLPPQIENLKIVVDSLIHATDFTKDIKIDQVKSVTEELYLSVMEVQEDIIQFTAQPEKISQEAKLIKIVSEVEKNIAVLEQYDFIDLSQVSDITARMSPQIAMEIDSESLAQIHDIAENAVNVLHDSSQEIPIADLTIVEDFFKTCQNEFTILRCLISKATSHKNIIRLLQEFNSLQTMINDFTTKRLELRLSDDVNECLTNFLILADECLRNARNSLIKVIDTQSDMLINLPVTQLESIHELKFAKESKTNNAIENVVKTLIDVADTSKSLANNLQYGIIEELSQPNQVTSQNQEEIVLIEKMEEIEIIVDAQLETKDLDNSSQKILQKLAACINKHHVYKDATGTGKTLLILKCLAECVTILQEEVTQKKISIDDSRTMKGKEKTLREVLVEILQPLQALQTQLANIREQVLTGAEEGSISIDITTTESIMQTMTELHKEIVQQIDLDKSTVDYEDISLIMEVDKEIVIIKDSIKSMENVQVAQTVKEITKPMEDIEKSLHTVLSSDKVKLGKETLTEESTDQLLNHIDQYIELIEIVEEISAIIKIENLKETFNIAQELRDSIAASENIPADELNKELLRSARAEQTRLAQKLQTALSILQVQVLDSAQELAPVLSADALQRIVQVTGQLQANLVAVTGIQIAVQAPAPRIETTKPAKTIHNASDSFSESVGADVKETMVLEQVFDIDKDALKEQVEVTSDVLEKKIAVSQETVVAKEERSQQESSEDITSLTTPHVLAREIAKESSVEIDTLEMEVMTETAAVKTVSANVAKVDGHILETPQQSLEEREEEFVVALDNLMQHINEYVSEDVIEVVNELSSLLNTEDFKQSINIAKELRASIAVIEEGKHEEVVAEINDQRRRQVEIIQGLQTALSVLNEQTLENLHVLVPTVNKSILEKIASVTDCLKTDLEIVKIYQLDILQSAQEEKGHEIKTEIKTAQLVKDDIAEHFEQPIMLTEESDKPAVEIAQTTVEDSSTLMSVAPTLETAVVTDKTKDFEPSEDLDELTSETKRVEEEVVSTPDEKPEMAAEHTDALLPKEITVQSESRTLDVNVLDHAIVTEAVEPTQQVVSEEKISEHIELTQKVVQIGQKMVDDEHVMSSLEAELDSSRITEEKVVPVVVLSDQAGELQHDTDRVDAKVVATETATVSQSIEPVVDTTPVDKVVTQTAKATEELPEATTDTLIQNIDTFLNNIANQTESQCSVDLKHALQIAEHLKKNILVSQINTADEMKNKPGDLEQETLVKQLQQALFNVQIQLLENVSEAQLSISKEEKSVASVILQLADNLAIALSSDTQTLIPEHDSKEILNETTQTEKIIEDIKDIQIIDTESVSSRQDSKIINIHIEQSLQEAIDEFVDCSSEFIDNKETVDSSNQIGGWSLTSPEIVLTETTKPFEEFFDSPTLPNKLPSAELLATEITEMTILENTNNVEKDSKATANLGLNDSLASAVTIEVSVTEATAMRKDEGFTTEVVTTCPEVEKPFFEVVSSKVNVKETNTQQENVNQTFVLCHDAKPILSQDPQNTSKMENLHLKTTESVVTETDKECLGSPPPSQKLPTTELVATEIEKLTILDPTKNLVKGDLESTIFRESDNLASTVSEDINITENPEASKIVCYTPGLISINPEVKMPFLEAANSSKVYVEETTIQQDNNTEENVTVCHDAKSVDTDILNGDMKMPIQEAINKNLYQKDFLILETSENIVTETIKPIEELLDSSTAEYSVTIGENISTTIPQCIKESAPVNIERCILIQHLDEFISEDVIAFVNEISNITNSEELKESIAVARKLRESVMATDSSAIAEEASPMHESNRLEQAYLAQTFQDALSTLHAQTLDSAQILEPFLSTNALQRVSEIISHLQEDLTTVVVSKGAEEIIEVETGDVIEIEEQNSMAQLETLLQDVNKKITLTSANRTADADDSESLKDTLDEVQTVIIKLKREYDGATNDALNETLEDLECSVRSVQLQINEESPPELLTEACATLQLLVDNMTTIQQVQDSQTTLKSEITEHILAKCSKETEETVKLLDEATKLDTKGKSSLKSVVSKLNTIRDNLKSLRESFLVDSDTVIENGVKVVQCLDQIEENIFLLEREVELAENITVETRDSIITAVHSVYGSISNMRSTVSSVQKRYMFENYGKPSESLLHSIKNIALISSFDDEENRDRWKRLSKSLRKVLNHFEDIKFYINLDKTARLPSDAAFTKIILEELKENVLCMSTSRAIVSDSHVIKKVKQSIECVKRNLSSIESELSLEVKNKIPMFKDLASEMLTTTTFIKSYFEKAKKYPKEPLEEPPDIKSNNEILNSNQDSAVCTVVQQQADSMSTVVGIPKDSPTSSREEIFETEIVNIAQTDVVPSTSNLIKDEVTETAVKYVTEAEITIPLEKQALLLEVKSDCASSEIVEDLILDTSTSFKETITLNLEQNQTEVITQSMEIDKLNQAQTSQSVVKIDDDISSKASTSHEKNIEEVIKTESQAEKAQITEESSVQVERKIESVPDIITQQAEYSAKIEESVAIETEDIQKQEKQNDDEKSLAKEDFTGTEGQLLTLQQKETVTDVDIKESMQTRTDETEKEVVESFIPKKEEAIPLKQETLFAKNQNEESIVVADKKDVNTSSLDIENAEKIEQKADILQEEKEACLVEDRKDELYMENNALKVKEMEFSLKKDDSQMETTEFQENAKLKLGEDVQDKQELKPKHKVDEAKKDDNGNELNQRQSDETRIRQEEEVQLQKEEEDTVPTGTQSQLSTQKKIQQENTVTYKQKEEDEDAHDEKDKIDKVEMELKLEQTDEDQAAKKTMNEDVEDKLKQEAQACSKKVEESLLLRQNEKAEQDALAKNENTKKAIIGKEDAKTVNIEEQEKEACDYKEEERLHSDKEVEVAREKEENAKSKSDQVDTDHAKIDIKEMDPQQRREDEIARQAKEETHKQKEETHVKQEEKSRLQKEKDEECVREMKAKTDEEKREDTESNKNQEDQRVKKESEETELKQKQKEKHQSNEEKEAQVKIERKDEDASKTKEITVIPEKLQEDADKFEKEKDEVDLKQRQDENERKIKQTELIENQDEEAPVKEEDEAQFFKEQDEKNARKENEKTKKIIQDTGDANEAKTDTEEEDLKHKLEEKEYLKKETEIKQKQDEEACVREAEEVRLHKEQEIAKKDTTGKEDAEKATRIKEEMDLKQKLEEEECLVKETELKQRQEEVARVKKEEEALLHDKQEIKDMRDMKKKAKIDKKVKEDADKAEREKDEMELKQKLEEVELVETETPLKPDELDSVREEEKARLHKQQEEKIERDKKEKDKVDNKEKEAKREKEEMDLKHKLEEDECVIKETELKQKQDEETRIKEEKEARFLNEQEKKNECEEKENIKTGKKDRSDANETKTEKEEVDVKQKLEAKEHMKKETESKGTQDEEARVREEEARLHTEQEKTKQDTKEGEEADKAKREKEEIDLKQKLKEEERLKIETELQQKQDEESRVREEEQARLHTEQEKTKHDKKEREDADKAKREKEEIDLKQKLKEKELLKIETELQQKQDEESRAREEEQARLHKQQEEKDGRDNKEKAKKDKKEIEDSGKAKREKEEIDLKQQLEEEERLKEETELKQKQDEESRIMEDEEARLHKDKEEKYELEIKEKAERETEERLKNETELKQKEEARVKEEEEARLHKEQEKKEARIKKEKLKKEKKKKEDADKAKREKEEMDLQQKLEEERLKQETELKQKQEEEALVKEEEEARLNKDQVVKDVRTTKKKAKTDEKEDTDKAEREKDEIDLKKNLQEESLKTETELKQKQEKAARVKDEEEARLHEEQEIKDVRDTKKKAKTDKKEKEDADKAESDKDEMDLKQKLEERVETVTQLKPDEEARVKEEQESRLYKEKEENDAREKKEKAEKAYKEKEYADNAKRKTDEMDRNQKLEEEERLKTETELKQKQEEVARVKDEGEARFHKEKEIKDVLDTKKKAKTDKTEKEDADKAKREKDEMDLKQNLEEVERVEIETQLKPDEEARVKEEQESRLYKEQEENEIAKSKTEEMDRNQKLEEEERLKTEAELKLKQYEAGCRKEVELAQLKKEQEEKEELEKNEKAKKEKEELDLKQKLEEKEREIKQTELIEKHNKETRERQDEEARLYKEQEEKDARKKKEKAKKTKNEIEEIDLKQKQEEEERLKQETELKQKHDEEARLREEEEARHHEEQEEKDARDKKEKSKKEKKKKGETDIAKKEKEEILLKQKLEEEKEQLNKETLLKQKQEEAARVRKDEDARLKKDQVEKDERQKKEKATEKNEELDLKQKLVEEEELKAHVKKENELKQKLDEEACVKKEKEDRTHKEQEKKETREKKENAKKDNKGKENTENKEKDEVDLKQNLEVKERVKYESELTQEQEKEARANKETEAHLQKEKDSKSKKKVEDDASTKKVKSTRTKKDKEDVEMIKKEMEIKQKQMEKEESEVRDQKEKEDAERKQKEEKHTGTIIEKDKKIKKPEEEETSKVKKERDEMELKQKQTEKELLTKKKDDADELMKNGTKYTEKLVKSEKRDDEIHIYTRDSDKLMKKENGDIVYKSGREVSHEQHYIREYQYEPSQIGYRLEAREKPRFVDHNHRDYTMEFARPTGYRERSFDVEKTDSLPTHDQLGRNTAIYRAQTIVLDAQLRSSAPPYPDTSSSKTPEPSERRSEIRHRSKALSEARSVISEKRTGLSRDSKRKPVFSTYLTDRTAVEGSRVKLTCSVLSSSDPTVTWYKNGVLLDNKLKYRTKYMDGLITLEVLNAVPSDSAEYSCTIQNENGSVNSSANLKVYPSFEASPIPPTFTRSIRDTYHLAENELVLECRIRGQPLPTITWLKDERPISTNSRYQAYYLADGVCRLSIEHPTPEDSGKYTCKAENSVWSDQITHVVNFTGRESRLSPNIATIEKSRFNRQALESRRPHFTNVLSDYKVVQGGTIGLQVEIRGAPTRVEWLREGCSVTEIYRNAKTFVEQGLYTLALSDVTEKESGMYTCRAWSSQCHVDMNAAITVVQPNELDGKPAIIVGRPEKDILISVGEDVNISFRVQGEPRPKVIFMKGIRDITTNQRVCKMTSDDYVKFTLKRSVVSDAGTYCILARNAYGCDRAFVTVVVRQRASSDNLISDWTYPIDDSVLSIADRRYKSVPERIPGVPSLVEGGNNWISLGWSKSEPGPSAPVLAYKVESWLLGKEGGARWVELGITPLNSFDVFNLKQGEEYHFRVTPRNRYGWGESVQTSSPIGVGLAGDRPEFSLSLPGQLKILVRETANLSCRVKGKPVPEVVWMKNGHEIEDEDKRLSSSFNGFDCCLTIKDINIEDEARYSCEATNVHGRASTYARLAVVTDRSIWEADAKLKRERSADAQGDYPPQFTMRLRDRRVQATYPVRLTCQVIGSPDPSITWFKDGEEVKPDSRRSHFQDEHFHTLEIAPTTLEDGGVYEAMARNNSGAVSCHCSLVVDKGIRAYVAPEFCCGLEPLYRLIDGEELRISAVVEAYPSVGVTWYRDGVRLRPSRRAIMTLDRDGQIELALAAVTSRDAGVYMCTASNEVGRASTSGKVEVTGTDMKQTPPVFISPDEPYSKEPMFIRKPRSSEAREGDTVIIACTVIGDPKPDVYWLRDFLKPDYYRDSSHFKRMGDGPEYRFEIPHAKLDYTGAYSVVARNQHGEAKAVISLQILAKDPTSSDETHNVRYGRVEVLPQFTKELTDLLSCDGDAVQFECRLSGHPEPHVRWFHYNELIRECPDFETSFEEGTARMKIKQVTAEDEGTYTCEAANNLGKATSSACLVVYPPGEPNTLSQRLRRPPAFLSAASTPRSTPRSTPARSVSRTPGPETRRLCSPARTLAPSFYTYPYNKVVEEGETVTLQCAIKGNPAPWATWDKDGVIITPSSRITIKEKDDVLRILEIDQVTIEDVGVYRITIENEFGRQEATARIEVITQKGKFYAGVRAVSPSPRKSLTYRSRRPSTPRQD